MPIYVLYIYMHIDGLLILNCDDAMRAAPTLLRQQSLIYGFDVVSQAPNYQAFRGPWVYNVGFSNYGFGVWSLT